MKQLYLLCAVALMFALPAVAQSYDENYDSYTAELTTDTSGLREATAETIEDDVYDLTNVNTWQRLDVENVFGYVGVTSDKESTLAAGTHVTGDDDLASVSWQGNLWSDADTGIGRRNAFTGMYGWKNMALQLFYKAYEAPSTTAVTFDFDDFDTYEVALTGYEQSCFGVKFGMEVDEQVSLNLSASYAETSGDDSSGDALKMTNPVIGAEVWYVLEKTEKRTVQVGASYTGDFRTADYAGADWKYNVQTITPEMKMHWFPVDRFEYGLSAVLPVGFHSFDIAGSKASAVKLDMTIRNGFSVAVTPDKFILNLGMETDLPYILFPEDEDTEYGVYANSYYGGFSVYLIPEVRLDACATITSFNKTDSSASAEDIWKQKFVLSLRTSF